MDTKSERWALFWCHLLHDLLFEELTPGERGKRLRELASQSVVYPDGVLRRGQFPRQAFERLAVAKERLVGRPPGE